MALRPARLQSWSNQNPCAEIEIGNPQPLPVLEFNGMEEDLYPTMEVNGLRYTGNRQPPRPNVGELYFDTASREYKVWNGTTWIVINDLPPIRNFSLTPEVDEEYGVTAKKLKELAMDVALESDDPEVKELVNKLMVHVKLKHNDKLKAKCPRSYDDTLIGGERLSPYAIAGTYMGNS